MKKLLVGFAVLAAMVGAANATDQPIDVTATVAAFCSIDGQASGVLANKTINLTPTAISGGNVTATAVSVNVGTVICNKAATAQLISTKGALLGPAASGSVQNYINYNATTTLLQTQATVAATVTTGTATLTSGAIQNQVNAFNTANVNVTVTPVAAGPLVSGSYSDLLTLRIEPQP